MNLMSTTEILFNENRGITFCLEFHLQFSSLSANIEGSLETHTSVSFSVCRHATFRRLSLIQYTTARKILLLSPFLGHG